MRSGKDVKRVQYYLRIMESACYSTEDKICTEKAASCPIIIQAVGGHISDLPNQTERGKMPERSVIHRVSRRKQMFQNSLVQSSMTSIKKTLSHTNNLPTSDRIILPTSITCALRRLIECGRNGSGGMYQMYTRWLMEM